MDHKTAIQNDFARRYVIGDLTRFERDMYEKHFLRCVVCAEQVRIAVSHLSKIRQQALSESTIHKKRFRLNWFSAFNSLLSRLFR